MTAATEQSSPRPKISPLFFVVGGLSYVPLIGVLFGLLAIAVGMGSRRAGGIKLALVGLGGIAFSFIVYGALFYFGTVQRGGIYDQLRETMAQSNLNSLVNLVEVYKVRTGRYPDSLEEVGKSLPENSFDRAFLIDPRVRGTGLRSGFFYYRRIDDAHYVLRGVAANGDPFSPGALIPQVSTVGLGLVVDKPPNE